jgi:hypothetical protein
VKARLAVLKVDRDANKNGYINFSKKRGSAPNIWGVTIRECSREFS